MARKTPERKLSAHTAARLPEKDYLENLLWLAESQSNGEEKEEGKNQILAGEEGQLYTCSWPPSGPETML